MKLHLSPDFTLPAEAVTQTFGIIGMRGSGKSNAAVVMAEEMFHAKLHWVAIDPKGDWWGVRAGSERGKPGLPVVVFGGRHGDVPLEPASGPMLADLIIDQTMTCVLDLSEFTEGEKIRFLAGAGGADGFAARFYRRKSEDQPPTHLFLEEADDYLPQKAMRDKAKLLHDCSRLFLWGRARGVGGTLVTQRSARIHKDSFTQVGTLIVFRTPAPQDQKAVLDWVKYHGQSEEVMASLSGLADGEGWVWSPEWLSVMKRVQFRHRITYDSGKTPKLGQKARAPATLADVDLGSIKDKMAATIERAKASDPSELKKRIAELERQAKVKPGAASASAPVSTQAIERAVAEARRDVERQFRAREQQLRKDLEQAHTRLARIGALAAVERSELPPVEPLRNPTAVPRAEPRSAPATTVAKTAATVSTAAAAKTGNGTASGTDQRILDGLAELEAIGVGEPERVQVAMLAGYKNLKSKGFSNAMGSMRTRGLIIYPGPGTVKLTDDGRSQASAVTAPRSNAELHERVLLLLGPGYGKVLRPILDVYPADLARDEVAASANYGNLKSKGFSNAVGRLRSLGLIDYPVPSRVRARDVLFPFPV